MTGLRSLQLRLAITVGLAVSVMWLGAVAYTTQKLRVEMEGVYDSALRDSGRRLLMLAGAGPGGRPPQRSDGAPERLEPEIRGEARFSYVISGAGGDVILQSDGTDPSQFPPFDRKGFDRTEDHALFYDRARRDEEVLTIVVAEPLSWRAAKTRDIAISLSLPLLLVIPPSLLVIFLVVGRSLAPVHQLRRELKDRSAHNLAPLERLDLPSELAPIVRSINELLARLDAAFEAERSFAANAAHELRTPVAGAIAQAQRLLAETGDPQAAARAGEIESTLKRLNGLSEKLMQLARAEGAQLRTGAATDLRPILRMVADDFERLGAAGRLELSVAEEPVLSDLDPDAFGILLRNLIENALRHGAADAAVRVSLMRPASLAVSNAGPVIAPGDLAQMTTRFARGAAARQGAGLGLAIVRTIAERANADLSLHSPASDRRDGVEVRVALPASGA